MLWSVLTKLWSYKVQNPGWVTSYPRMYKIFHLQFYLRTFVNPLSANATERLNTLKQFVGNLFECVWPLWRLKGQFMKKEPFTQFYGRFDHLPWTYEVAKIWMITLRLDVIGLMHAYIICYTGVYPSINWPPFTRGQKSILNLVLKLNPINQKVKT